MFRRCTVKLIINLILSPGTPSVIKKIPDLFVNTVLKIALNGEEIEFCLHLVGMYSFTATSHHRSGFSLAEVS